MHSHIYSIKFIIIASFLSALVTPLSYLDTLGCSEQIFMWQHLRGDSTICNRQSATAFIEKLKVVMTYSEKCCSDIMGDLFSSSF